MIKNKLSSYILLFFLIILFSTSKSFAELSPEETVNNAMNDLKKSGNLGPLVDYIDWNKMYMELSENKKNIMNVKSPEQLKEFNRRVLTSPSTEISNLLNKQGNLSNGIDESKLEQVVKKIEDRLKEKEERIQEKITNTKYEVLDTKVNADIAKVTLKQTYLNETKEDQISMHKVGDSWYFSSLSELFSKEELKGLTNN